jgi:hypothetical protein
VCQIKLCVEFSTAMNQNEESGFKPTIQRLLVQYVNHSAVASDVQWRLKSVHTHSLKKVSVWEDLEPTTHGWKISTLTTGLLQIDARCSLESWPVLLVKALNSHKIAKINTGKISTQRFHLTQALCLHSYLDFRQNGRNSFKNGRIRAV